MKILSLNAAYGEQLPVLREYLSSELELGKTAVYCFQESAGDIMQEVVKEHFDSDAFDVINVDKTTPDSRYGFTTAVKKPNQVQGYRPLLPDEDPTIGQAVATEIKLANGSLLTVVNVHGAPFPGDKLDNKDRLKQSKSIIEALGSIATPCVVCGDFNLLPETESLKMFSQAGFVDINKQHGYPTTRNKITWEQYPDNPQLHADYVFVSPEVTYSNFYVPDPEQDNIATQASDHLPIVIDLDI